MLRKRRGVMGIVVCIAAVLFAGCGSGFFTDRVDTGTGGTTARFAYVANFNNGGAGTVTGFTVNTTTRVLSSFAPSATSKVELVLKTVATVLKVSTTVQVSLQNR